MQQPTPCRYQATLNGVIKSTVLNNATLELTIYVQPAQLQQQHHGILSNHPKARQYLTNSDQNDIAADNNSVKQICDYLTQGGLSVTDSNNQQRLIKATASVETISKLFSIDFYLYYNTQGFEHLAYHGCVKIPTHIDSLITHIDGLNTANQIAHRSTLRYSPVAHLNPNLATGNQTPSAQAQDGDGTTDTETNAASSFSGYTPAQIEQVYQFPDQTGAGQTIGIIELGGTYKPDDLAAYCAAFGLETPQVEIVGDIPPSSQMINDIEVNMDVQLATGLAPQAKLIIYYGKTFVEAIRLALFDQTNQPSVLSISWANGESSISQSEQLELQYLCHFASLNGITIVSASGDHGIYEVGNAQQIGVNYPAALPHVIGVGGTTLWSTQGNQTVWDEMATIHDASGGGYSRRIDAPYYQQQALHNYQQQFPQAPLSSRAVPDIAASASSQKAYAICFNGKFLALGAGTSASTPVIASLIARLNHALGYRLGFINRQFYQLMGSAAFDSNISGSNGPNGYPSALGWDPCTGLGSPNGKMLLEALKVSEHYQAQGQ